ncbi:hypothetical protein BDZ89DRAFT_778814 [Hymenopellis radicata]|nr:hypothetical protein BDZ89DRAFT_778814 [Hymenopellis radicata]
MPASITSSERKIGDNVDASTMLLEDVEPSAMDCSDNEAGYLQVKHKRRRAPAPAPPMLDDEALALAIDGLTEDVGAMDCSEAKDTAGEKRVCMRCFVCEAAILLGARSYVVSPEFRLLAERMVNESVAENAVWCDRCYRKLATVLGRRSLKWYLDTARTMDQRSPSPYIGAIENATAPLAVVSSLITTHLNNRWITCHLTKKRLLVRRFVSPSTDLGSVGVVDHVAGRIRGIVSQPANIILSLVDELVALVKPRYDLGTEAGMAELLRVGQGLASYILCEDIEQPNLEPTDRKALQRQMKKRNELCEAYDGFYNQEERQVWKSVSSLQEDLEEGADIYKVVPEIAHARARKRIEPRFQKYRKDHVIDVITGYRLTEEEKADLVFDHRHPDEEHTACARGIIPSIRNFHLAALEAHGRREAREAREAGATEDMTTLERKALVAVIKNAIDYVLNARNSKFSRLVQEIATRNISMLKSIEAVYAKGVLVTESPEFQEDVELLNPVALAELRDPILLPFDKNSFLKMDDDAIWKALMAYLEDCTEAIDLLDLITYYFDIEKLRKITREGGDANAHRYIPEDFKYQCGTCGMSFRGFKSLQRHMTTHDESRPTFACNHDLCGKIYLRQDSLTVHIQNVHENRKYPCVWEKCDNVYTSASGLASHVKAEHEKKKFPCTWPK